MRIYTNKIENRFMFKIKTGYSLLKQWNYLEVLKVR